LLDTSATGVADAMIEAHSRICYIRRFTGALLLLGSVGLLASSVYRAATFPFTYDESRSFAIFNWDPRHATTANNHLLNTLLMKWCSTLFGNSELSLRLPNILAHVIYLVCALLLLKRFQHAVLQMAGFVLLNLNPFLLDFFFLARGYGLALAFLMLSLYLLARAYEEKQQQKFAKYLYLSVSAGSLAVLANFAFLNYHLPLLLASAWLLFSDASLRRFSRSHILTAIALFSASGVFLAVILYKTFQLQWRGRLFYGGKVGFISDTVGSLVRSSLYSRLYSDTTDTTIAAILIGLFGALLLLGLYLFFLRKEVPLFVLFLLVLASAAVLPILQHRLVLTLFPIQRAALYYLPLYAVVLLSALHSLGRLSSRRWKKLVVLVLPAAIAAILSWHFYRSFNPHTCYTWWYDGHNEEILEIINRDRKLNFPGRTVNLCNGWLFGPSLNFYRITRNYTWLAPVTRKPIGKVSCSADDDYVYAFESEVKELPIGHHIGLTSYPDTQTVLLRVNRAYEP
jgi:uncharacterized membrane protein